MRTASATPKTWYWAFALGTLTVLSGLSWLSVGALRSAEAERIAHLEAEKRTTLRLALWRLDAWIGGFLAREAARSTTEYLPGSTTSPLHTFHSDFIQLHFEMTGTGELTAPWLRDRRQVFHDLERVLDPEWLRSEVAAAESFFAEQAAFGELRGRSSLPPFVLEFSHRAAAGTSCQTPEAPGVPQESFQGEQQKVGPLIPLWLESEEPRDRRPPSETPSDFIYVRRVEGAAGESFQGFLGDWEALRAALLSQLTDLYPEADLRPALRGPEAFEEQTWGRQEPTLLATLPATLHIPPRPVPAAPYWTPTRYKLAVVWAAACIAIAAVGCSLWASVGFGRRRQRFASAVTHELRTPLTTFQMYTEMLADGTVNDPALRKEYLEILRDESTRLSGLVENVLTYAELEEGVGRPRQLERLSLATLLERVSPPLHRLALAADCELEVGDEVGGVFSLMEEGVEGGLVEVDVDLVVRLLSNLIDNACKYAGPVDRRVHLNATVEDLHLVLRVRDHGPGVPPEHAQRIFKPFARHIDRSIRRSDRTEEPQPGVGLGLALTRDLARASGGDLTFERPTEGGACFELRLQAMA